jgi:adenylate cyclase
MSRPWQILVYERHSLVYSTSTDGEAVELGRQKTEAEGVPSQLTLESGRRRVVIARLNEDTVSRQHALLEPLDDDRARVRNLSQKLPIGLADGSVLRAGEAREVALPALLVMGKKTVRVQSADQGEEGLERLNEATIPPGQSLVTPRFPTLMPSAGTGLEPETVVRWLQTMLSVLQSAASSADFFQKAARAVVDLVGLESGRVLLLLDGGEWREEAFESSPGVLDDPDRQASRGVLVRVLEEKRTIWQVSGPAQQPGGSLLGVRAVVAAPILDSQGRVIGALYGDRRKPMRGGSPPLGRLEAMLVELLASGVATGLARMEQERVALAARVQMEQFFTPSLSRELAARPDLLEGRDCEVTVLVCDIRGFSRISERLQPATTLEWLRDVLGALSECVLDRDGVLVDYTGDEIMAMWGAPGDQPDHARIACEAAVAMIGRLPELNVRWQSVVQEPIGLGVGVNTGPARVGNTGSVRKFKYGPHGNMVNLASRVQGATKYLKSPVLITGPTRERLGDAFPTRRLCRVRVVNIGQPVELFQLALAADANWLRLKAQYEAALEVFERREFLKAMSILGPLMPDYPDDGPSGLLMGRAVEAHQASGEYDPVWTLPGK